MTHITNITNKTPNEIKENLIENYFTQILKNDTFEFDQFKSNLINFTKGTFIQFNEIELGDLIIMIHKICLDPITSPNDLDVFIYSENHITVLAEISNDEYSDLNEDFLYIKL